MWLLRTLTRLPCRVFHIVVDNRLLSNHRRCALMCCAISAWICRMPFWLLVVLVARAAKRLSLQLFGPSMFGPRIFSVGWVLGRSSDSRFHGVRPGRIHRSVG